MPSRDWLCLSSSEGLTEAERSASMMAHLHAHWQGLLTIQTSPQDYGGGYHATWWLASHRGGDPKESRGETAITFMT